MTEYERFEAEMKKRDAKLPSFKPGISIGMKDEKGNLLVLGGHKVNIWLLASGKYAVAGDITDSGVEAVILYNQYNGTKLDTDHIWKVFWPWYRSKDILVAMVPSSSDPNVEYAVRKNLSGELTCECRGFQFYHHCWHTDAVKEIANVRGIKNA